MGLEVFTVCAVGTFEMNKVVIAPKLPAELQAITAQQFVADARLEAVTVSGAAIALSAKGLTIDEAVLNKVTVNEAQLEKLGLSDVIMKSCDFSATNCSDGSWIRVQAGGGRMTGIDLNKCVLKDVVFEGCKLDMANFRFAKLTRVRFVDCVLSETDFQGAELTQVDFEDCMLEKVEFAQAKLKDVDARGSQLV